MPQVEPIVRTAIEDLIEHGNWMSTNLAGAQSQNWRTFNTGLFDTIVNGPSKTGEEWWKHGQKHIFSIRTDEAQQSAQAGVFGMGNISSKVACNTIAVLRTDMLKMDVKSAAISLFIQSRPMLQKVEDNIAFVSSIDFLLPVDICEYFIFVEGPERTPLIDGIPHIVPLEIAQTTILNGILKLTCWDSEKIVKNPGTLFFRMNQFLTSYHESIEQQTYVAALLGMNKFIETSLETMPASEEKNELLLGILSRLTSMSSLVSLECRKNIELTKKVLQKNLKKSSAANIGIISFPTFAFSQSESASLLQKVTDEMMRDRFFVDWYQRFFSFVPNTTPIVDVIIEFLKRCDDNGTFEGLESFREVAETEEFSKYMSLFSAFVLYPRNKEVIYGIISKDKRLSQFARVVEGGSILATAMTIALKCKQFDWVAKNLKPFSFLYQFANASFTTIELEKDYDILMPIFLSFFSEGKWIAHGREFPELTQRMNIFLLSANAYSSGMSTSKIAQLGFSQAMTQSISDYIYHAWPSLEKIVEIQRTYGKVKDKKTVQKFKEKTLYPALLSRLNRRSADLVQKFEEEHRENNIDTKIRHIKDIIKQIDRAEKQKISQE